MSFELLIYTSRHRDQFIQQDFTAENNILALSESGTYTFEDGNGSITVNPFEAVFFEKGVHYKRKTITPVTVHFFRFTCDEMLFDTHHIKFYDKDRIASTIRMLNSVSTSIPLQNDFSCVQSLFGDIITLYKMENASRLSFFPTNDVMVCQALEILGSSYHQKIHLPDIAQSLGLSYVHFSRRFKYAVGMTPSDYLTNLRLNKAQQLLTSTDLSIREIAPLCGFDSEYYFSAFFKKKKKISPSLYRGEF